MRRRVGLRFPQRVRCRACGSKRMELIWVEPPGDLPPSIPPVFGGDDATPPEGKLRWRCARCGTSKTYRRSDASIWQRRRPLFSWLSSMRG